MALLYGAQTRSYLRLPMSKSPMEWVPPTVIFCYVMYEQLHYTDIMINGYVSVH